MIAQYAISQNQINCAIRLDEKQINFMEEKEFQKIKKCYLIQLTPGCIVRKSPISEPFPVTQLMRPLGKPAKWKQWTMCSAATAPCKDLRACHNFDQQKLLFEHSEKSIQLNYITWKIQYVYMIYATGGGKFEITGFKLIPGLGAWARWSFRQLVQEQFLKQQDWQDS